MEGRAIPVLGLAPSNHVVHRPLGELLAIPLDGPQGTVQVEHHVVPPDVELGVIESLSPLALEVSPHPLNWVELRGGGRQELELQAHLRSHTLYPIARMRPVVIQNQYAVALLYVRSNVIQEVLDAHEASGAAEGEHQPLPAVGDAAQDGDVLAPILLELDADRVVLRHPEALQLLPQVRRGLVEVNDLLVGLLVCQEIAQELDAGVGLLLFALVPIAELKGGAPPHNAVVLVDLPKVRPRDLEPLGSIPQEVLLPRHLKDGVTPLLHGLVLLLHQGLAGDDVLHHLARDLALARIHAVTEPVKVSVLQELAQELRGGLHLDPYRGRGLLQRHELCGFLCKASRQRRSVEELLAIDQFHELLFLEQHHAALDTLTGRFWQPLLLSDRVVTALLEQPAVVLVELPRA